MQGSCEVPPSYPAHAGYPVRRGFSPRNTGSPAFAGDDDWKCGAFVFIRHESAIPRRDAPELCMNDAPLENRGRGECRMLAAPIASRAKWKQAHERSHHRYSRIHPAFPHAMVLTAYFVLSPVS